MGGQANTPVPFNNNLQVTTTNQGADNITNNQYAAFDDVLFSANGFTFSLSNGSLIATIKRKKYGSIDIGKLTFTHKGDYAGGTAYVANDVVYYNGSATSQKH